MQQANHMLLQWHQSENIGNHYKKCKIMAKSKHIDVIKEHDIILWDINPN